MLPQPSCSVGILAQHSAIPKAAGERTVLSLQRVISKHWGLLLSMAAGRGAVSTATATTAQEKNLLGLCHELRVEQGKQ